MLAVPVCVTVPVTPVGSTAVNCTRVLLLKPRPTRVMLWPGFAETTLASLGVPSCAVVPPDVKLNFASPFTLAIGLPSSRSEIVAFVKMNLFTVTLPEV